MKTIVRTAVARFLQAQSDDEIKRHITGVGDMGDRFLGYRDTIEALIRAGMRRRLDRVGQVEIRGMDFDGRRLSGKVRGSQGAVYTPHITFQPQGHFCTCPDWQRRGRSVGPCKHVLALGLHWREERLNPAIEDFDNRLISILERPLL